MDGRYPEQVRRLNRLLVSELGSQPRYAWRWSEDLLHVMAVVDELGRPQYVDVPINLANGKIIYGRQQARMVRKLLPGVHEQWVACALVETSQTDGEISQTGNGSWVPISSSASGVAALPHGMKPTDDLTQCVVRVIRVEREMASRNKNYLTEGFLEDASHKEKSRWNKAYDRISNASTAFYNAPGRKGHVSFPTVKAPHMNGLTPGSGLRPIQENLIKES